MQRLSPESDEAVRTYEVIGLKLLRYFEWRGCESPDHCVDETFDRVMRRLDEGQEIANVMGYFYSVARLVFMEVLKERKRRSLMLDNLPTTVAPAQLDSEQDDPRQRCFETCINALTGENRKLILDYYRAEKREKIDLRKKLATELNIPLNALRIRAHRIRNGLEDCVRKCLRQYAVSK